MAKNVLPSQGTTISVKTGSNYTKISGVTDFSGIGSGAASIIDVTDLDSVAKEKQMGIPDEGSIKISVNYIVADAGQVACDTARTAGTLASFKVVASGTQWTFDAFVPSFEKSGGVDKQWTGAITLEVSGPVTKGTAA